MKTFQHQFTAMGSPCKIILQGNPTLIQQAFNDAHEEVLRIEKKYSRYNNSSLLQSINNNAGIGAVEIDEETAGLLNYAQFCYQESQGLFDISSGILRKAWNFKSQKLPSQKEINNLLPLIDWPSIQWTNKSIFLPKKKMEIDFGGFGKEYAADKAAAICRSLGLSHGLVDLGGDISLVGDKEDQSGWTIGIRNPSAPNQALRTITLHEGALATSGNYERFMKIRDKHYCHILKATTGWPVNHLASISIIAPQCLVAGSLATLCMLKEQQGIEWLKEQEVPFIAIDTSGKQFSSDDI